jgi:hypothetical protein
MSKTPRAQTIQTPGVEPLPDAGTDAAAAAAAGDGQSEGNAEDDLPPDVQRVIEQRVDQRLAQIRRTERLSKANPATGRDDLPTQAEALAKVTADPKHRAILSRDGWVTAPEPVKGRDESGFAKA